MQTLDLEDKVATELQQIAKQAHLSTSDLLSKMLAEYSHPKKESGLMSDIIKDLPKISVFKGEPLDIQRKMRNEWD